MTALAYHHGVGMGGWIAHGIAHALIWRSVSLATLGMGLLPVLVLTALVPGGMWLWSRRGA